MKFFTLMFFVLFITASAIAQDTIANPGFENWAYTPVPNPGYYNPDPWHTLNSLTALVGTTTAYQDSVPSEVHSGKYSLKLVTKVAGPRIAPGMLSSGPISQSGPYGGTPINSRPQKMNGWFKYFPFGADTASMEIHLFKWNSATMTHDEIGTGIKLVSDSVTSWTNFSVPVSYTSTAVPDTALLLFFASNNNPKVNTILLLDDLSYDYTSDVKENETLEARVFPNPVSDEITVSFDQERSGYVEINLFSIDGKLMKNLFADKNNSSSFTRTFDISGLTCGVYLLEIKDGVKGGYHKIIVE